MNQNTWDFLRDAMITLSDPREYDARKKYPGEISLTGIKALGLGTQMHRHGIDPAIAAGNESLSVKSALILGLMKAGTLFKDNGPALSPMAQFT